MRHANPKPPFKGTHRAHIGISGRFAMRTVRTIAKVRLHLECGAAFLEAARAWTNEPDNNFIKALKQSPP